MGDERGGPPTKVGDLLPHLYSDIPMVCGRCGATRTGDAFRPLAGNEEVMVRTCGSCLDRAEEEILARMGPFGFSPAAEPAPDLERPPRPRKDLDD